VPLRIPPLGFRPSRPRVLRRIQAVQAIQGLSRRRGLVSRPGFSVTELGQVEAAIAHTRADALAHGLRVGKRASSPVLPPIAGRVGADDQVAIDAHGVAFLTLNLQTHVSAQALYRHTTVTAPDGKRYLALREAGTPAGVLSLAATSFAWLLESVGSMCGLGFETAEAVRTTVGSWVPG